MAIQGVGAPGGGFNVGNAVGAGNQLSQNPAQFMNQLAQAAQANPDGPEAKMLQMLQQMLQAAQQNQGGQQPQG